MPANRPGRCRTPGHVFSLQNERTAIIQTRNSALCSYTAAAESRQWLTDQRWLVFALHYEVPKSRMPRYALNDPIFQNGATPDLVATQIISNEQSDDCISKSVPEKLTALEYSGALLIT